VNPPAEDLESATSAPHRKHQNGIKSANIERPQALTLRPLHADATFAAKPTSSGPR
jgi:hypothetical protein